MRSILFAMCIQVMLLPSVHAEEPLDSSRIPQLIEELDDTSPEVRGKAADELAKFGPEAKSAIPKLVKLLSDKETHTAFGISLPVNFDAAQALASMGSEAVETLTMALESDDSDVRCRVIRTLGKIGTKAHNAIKRLMTIADQVPRAATADGDDRTIQSAVADDGTIQLEVIDAISKIDRTGDIAVPLLLNRLKDDDSYVRRFSVKLLGDRHDDLTKTFYPLVAKLKDNEPAVRGFAARALGNRPLFPETVVPKLIELLNDQNMYWQQSGCVGWQTSVSADAIEALGGFREASAIAMPELLEVLALGREVDSVAHTVSQLGQEAGPLIPKLIEILSKPEIKPSTQFAILKILINLGPTAHEAVPLIRKIFFQRPLVRQSRYDVTLASACALVSIDFVNNAEAWESVLNKARQPVRSGNDDWFSYYPNACMLLDTLGALGDRALPAAPILAKILEDQKALDGNARLFSNERELIAITLGKIDRESNLPTETLVKELGEKYGFDAESQQVSPLLQFGKASVRSLINGLTEFNENEHHLIQILEALGEFGERADDAILIVIRISQDERRDVRSAAAKTIGKIGKTPEVAVPALIRLLDDERPVVREQAAISLAAYKSQAASAKSKLAQLLKDEYIDVRLAAEATLEVVK